MQNETETRLVDIHNYYEDLTLKNKRRPILGNHRARMLIPVLYPLRGVSIILRGEAGSVKSTLIRGASQLVWGSDVINDKREEVVIIAGSSEKGMLSENIVNRIEKRAEYCIIPELEFMTSSDHNLNIIKLWTEGEPYKYTRSTEFGKSSKTLELKSLPILTSLANENQQLKELGEEMERRFLPLFTESSVSMNERVQKRKAEIEAYPNGELLVSDANKTIRAREHLQEIADIGFGQTPLSPKIKNPCAPFFPEEKIIPARFTIGHTYVDYWHEMVKAFTSFFYKDRMWIDGGMGEDSLYMADDETYLLATPADNFLAWMVGGQVIIDASLRLKDMGKVLMDVIPTLYGVYDSSDPEVRDALKLQQIMQELEDEGYIRSKAQIKKLLMQLEMCGYAKSTDDGQRKFWKTREYDEVHKSVDWKGLVEFTKDFVKDVYPNIAKDYIYKYCENPWVWHPFKENEKIRILDIEEEEFTRESGKRMLKLDDMNFG